ncbi:MAG: hypothetical protein L6W00_27040 [Lentisphaeria bacterium]|nr:MAG: hypothetical protein L6W00_27040 [Lentisphaeria bacterium]
MLAKIGIRSRRKSPHKKKIDHDQKAIPAESLVFSKAEKWRNHQITNDDKCNDAEKESP